MSMPNNNHAVLAYRREIDGLRAVAVLPVVLYHAGVSLLSGGFVGVDVFFVISGFLITSILLNEGRKTGRVSIAGFYARRIRRIAPALLTVLVASYVAAHELLLPGQYAGFAKSVVATLGFSSNMWFWSQTGYFTAQGGVEPLLHTWSLAVEEQYYLFAPLIIGLFVRSRRWLVAIFVAAAVVSFSMSVVGLWRSPSATFYWIPTRAWELLIGSILAMRILPQSSHAAAEMIALFGAVLIIASMLLLSEAIPFPGPTALPACLGTACIIYGTEGRETAVGRLLSTKAFVGIGLISYSLYLWHWPVIVFARQYARSGISVWLAVGVSVALAVATLFLVERPTRKGIATRPLLVFVGLVALALVGASFQVIRSGGVPSRLPPRAVALSASSMDRATLCSGHSELCDTRPRPTVAIFGDSHAAIVAEAYDAAGVPVRLMSTNSCPPGWSMAGVPPRDAVACAERNSTGLTNLLNAPAIKDVVLVANWPNYTAKDVRLHTARVVSLILAAGKRPAIFSGLPSYPGDLPSDLATAAWKGGVVKPLIRQPLVRISGARLIDGGSMLCEREICPPSIDGRSVLSDGNHVTRTVSRTRLSSLVRD